MSSFAFISCSDDKEIDFDDTWAVKKGLDKRGSTEVLRSYQIYQRGELNIPFQVYITRLKNGHDCYVRSLRTDNPLREGLGIKHYYTYKSAPNEVFRMVTVDGDFGSDDDDGEEAKSTRSVLRTTDAIDIFDIDLILSEQTLDFILSPKVQEFLCSYINSLGYDMDDIESITNATDDKFVISLERLLSTDLAIKSLGIEKSYIKMMSTRSYAEKVDVDIRSLIVSDEIVKKVDAVFEMGMRYGIPFLPISTIYFEIDGFNKVVYAKNSKVDGKIIAGEKIAYKVYKLYPNEIYSIRKVK